MLKKRNPVLIAGFDVLFLGEKGFSSLANAKKILVRPKGSKKSVPWTEINVAKKRSKKTKELALSKMLMQLTRKADAELDTPKKKKKRKKEVDVVDDIRFSITGDVVKLIRSLDGKTREIRKLYFDLPESLEFAKGKDINVMMIQSYLSSVKREIKRLFKVYGKTDYLIRITHEYKGLPSTQINDEHEKGFGGYSLHRQVFEGTDDIDDQFDMVLGMGYPESFTAYLKYASQASYFRFTGFSVEITTGIVGDDGQRKDEFRKAKRKAARIKVTVKKKPKKKTKKKTKKKSTKKKTKKTTKRKKRK